MKDVSDLRSWLAGRTPPPPDALRLAVPQGAGAPAEQLCDAAAETLDRALSGRGERRGAFDLLAADGLLTYACERAASGAEPEAELLRLIERFGRRAG